MFVQAFTVLVFFGLQAMATSYKHQSVIQTSHECPEGVHIVGIRGTKEECDPVTSTACFGELSKLLPDLLEDLPGSDTYAIDYPGTGIADNPDAGPYNITEYARSEAIGYSNLKAEISSFHTDCPNTGIVLMGYSQASTAERFI